MLIGAHVSSAGGTHNAIKNAEKLGVEYLQTFLSSPQSYTVTMPEEEKVRLFKETLVNSRIKGVYAHAIYLLNFASEKPQNVYLSGTNLTQTLTLSSTLEFDGVIIHLGSTKEDISIGIQKVAEGIKRVLSETPQNSTLLLENSAGSGNHIGSDYNHIVQLLEINGGNPRLKVCIDTQHSHAAGYNIKEEGSKIAEKIHSLFGDRLGLIHLNDSKTPFNSKKDRHENIGEGLIGLQGLKEFCTHPLLSSVPMVLEVPGFEGKGPDSENIYRVRSFKD